MWGPSRVGLLKDRPWFQDALRAVRRVRGDRGTCNQYAYAHHKTRDSFLKSYRNSCVICQYCHDLEDNEEMAGPGYFSIFWISIMNDQPEQIHIGIRYGRMDEFGRNTLARVAQKQG